MKKILTVLGIFVVLGFVFTGASVVSAAEPCIVGPLNVSEAAVVMPYGDGETVIIRQKMTDRVSSPAKISRYGDGEHVEVPLARTDRLSVAPEFKSYGNEEHVILPSTTC